MRTKKAYLRVYKLSLYLICFMLFICGGIFFLDDDETFNEEEIPKEEEESFLILNEKTGQVEKIDAYTYALGAVMAEMPPSFHIEALKAQSLSALTRARYLKAKYEKGEGYYENYHFSQNPDQNEGFIRPQRAGEIYGENEKICMDKMKKAADFAVKRCLTYEDEPILAAYHAMSPGFTEESQNVWGRSLPYLKKVESRGDTLAPSFIKKKEIPFDAVLLILKKAFPEGDFKSGEESSWIKILSTEKGGYVEKCLSGNIETTGKDLRNLFSLPSASFTIEIKDDNFIFTTKGFGHGVGLSQRGADFMARQGFTAEEILKYYYSGTEVNLI